MQVRLEFTFVVGRGKKMACPGYVQEKGKFGHSILSSLEGQEQIVKAKKQF